MHKKKADAPKRVFYILEETDEDDADPEGFWHSLELTDAGNEADIIQESQLEQPVPLAFRWKPLRVCVRTAKKTGDFFRMGIEHIAITKAAFAILRDLLGDSVEPLPLTITCQEHWTDKEPSIELTEDYPELLALHALHQVELAPNAKADYFPNQIIFQVKRYAFREADVAGKHFFRVKGDTTYLVSEEFRQFVKKNKLQGLAFRPVKWVPFVE